MTQRRLAVLCGSTPSYIGNVEQATVNITLANLERLASALQCWESDLLWKYLDPREPYHYPFAGLEPHLRRGLFERAGRLLRRRQTNLSTMGQLSRLSSVPRILTVDDVAFQEHLGALDDSGSTK